MKRLTCFILTVIFGLGVLGGCASKKDDKEKLLDPNNPTTISVWHYYNGAQQNAFEKLVTDFNEGIGKEKGIYVETYSQGSVFDLEKVVLDSANNKVGASEMPNIFAAYADTAYEVDRLGLVADISEYLTKDEINKYIDSYIEEGKFKDDGKIKIFPIAKSTEVLILNETDWSKFAQSTGASKDDISTVEGLVATAKKYYEWTDSLTSAPNDGKAFFGRDALANYFFIGEKQLGVDIIDVKDNSYTLNFDKETVKKIWENYYVPYVKGYFMASNRFRSGDMQIGNIIAYVGSSSGSSYYPTEVRKNDASSYPVEIGVYEAPKFKDSKDFAVQQGAGMVVTNTKETEVYASIEFLKWFTESERNMEFAAISGYLPVEKSANDMDLLKKVMKENENIADTKTMEVAIHTVLSNEMYTPKATKYGSKIRNVLEKSLTDKCDDDRNAVKNLIENGSSYEEAISGYISNNNFETWFNEVKEQLYGLNE